MARTSIGWRNESGRKDGNLTRGDEVDMTTDEQDAGKRGALGSCAVKRRIGRSGVMNAMVSGGEGRDSQREMDGVWSEDSGVEGKQMQIRRAECGGGC